MIADSDQKRSDVIRLICLREYCIRLRLQKDAEVFR